MYLADRYGWRLTYLLMVAFSGGVIIGFISSWLPRL